MTSDDEATLGTLQDQIASLSIRLAETRRALTEEEGTNLDDLLPELETCTRRLVDLSAVKCRRTKLQLLGLMDEVNQTAEALNEAMAQMRGHLSSVQRNRAVDAAYRQATKF